MAKPVDTQKSLEQQAAKLAEWVNKHDIGKRNALAVFERALWAKGSVNNETT